MTLQSFFESAPTIPIITFSMFFGSFVGLAFDPMLKTAGDSGTISLRDAMLEAHDATDWRVGARLGNWWSRNVQTQEIDPRVVMALWFIGMIVLTGLYLRWVETVAAVVVSSALAAMVGACLTFGILFWNKVVNGRGAIVRLSGALILACAAVFNGAALVSPPLAAGAADAVREQGLIGAPSLDTATVVMQPFGAFATVIVQLAAICYSASCVAAVYYALRPRLVWRWVYWLGRWAVGGWAFVVILLISALAYLLSSGWLAYWTTRGGDPAMGG